LPLALALVAPVVVESNFVYTATQLSGLAFVFGTETTGAGLPAANLQRCAVVPYKLRRRCRWQTKEEEEKKLSACRGEGSVAGPLLAVLRCRCAALLVLVLMSALAMPNSV
jgi:hypothetical protein